MARLSPLVLRVLGHNPGSFSLQGTNMYLVGSGASRLLVDAGQGKKEDLPTLLQAMSDDGAERISDVLITHYHHDHTEGIAGPDTCAEVNRDRACQSTGADLS